MGGTELYHGEADEAAIRSCEMTMIEITQHKTIRQKIIELMDKDFFHYFIIMLVLIDLVIVLIQQVLDIHHLEGYLHDGYGLHFAHDMLFVLSCLILSIFVIEIIAKIVVLGTEYLRDVLHLLDAIVILFSLPFEIYLHLYNHSIGQIAGPVIIVFRFWKILRGVHAIAHSVELKNQAIIQRIEMEKERAMERINNYQTMIHELSRQVLEKEERTQEALAEQECLMKKYRRISKKFRSDMRTNSNEDFKKPIRKTSCKSRNSNIIAVRKNSNFSTSSASTADFSAQTKFLNGPKRADSFKTNNRNLNFPSNNSTDSKNELYSDRDVESNVKDLELQVSRAELPSAFDIITSQISEELELIVDQIYPLPAKSAISPIPSLMRSNTEPKNASQPAQLGELLKDYDVSQKLAEEAFVASKPASKASTLQETAVIKSPNRLSNLTFDSSKIKSNIKGVEETLCENPKEQENRLSSFIPSSKESNLSSGLIPPTVLNSESTNNENAQGLNSQSSIKVDIWHKRVYKKSQSKPKVNKSTRKYNFRAKYDLSPALSSSFNSDINLTSKLPPIFKSQLEDEKNSKMENSLQRLNDGHKLWDDPPFMLASNKTLIECKSFTGSNTNLFSFEEKTKTEQRTSIVVSPNISKLDLIRAKTGEGSLTNIQEPQIKEVVGHFKEEKAIPIEKKSNSLSYVAAQREHPSESSMNQQAKPIALVMSHIEDKSLLTSPKFSEPNIPLDLSNESNILDVAKFNIVAEKTDSNTIIQEKPIKQEELLEKRQVNVRTKTKPLPFRRHMISQQQKNSSAVNYSPPPEFVMANISRKTSFASSTKATSPKKIIVTKRFSTKKRNAPPPIKIPPPPYKK